MGVSYDALGSELITESDSGLWRAGKRCPELFLNRIGDKQTIRLYQMLDYGKYLIISVGGSGQPGCSGQFSGVASHLTLLSPGSATEFSGDKVFTSEIVKSDDDFIVVVRPDMYIGYVGQGSGWQEYMAQVFVH